MRKIRKSWFVILLITGLILGCKGTEQRNLYFYGIPWKCSFEQIMETLNLSKEDAETYLEKDHGGVIKFLNLEVFGETADEIVFRMDGSTDVSLLYRVSIAYPDSADMEHVLKELVKNYGKPEKKKELVISNEFGLDLKTFESTDTNKFWASKDTIAAAEEEKDNRNRQFMLNKGKFEQLSDEAGWEQFKEAANLCALFWMTDGKIPAGYDNKAYKNRVIFYADIYVLNELIDIYS